MSSGKTESHFLGRPLKLYPVTIWIIDIDGQPFTFSTITNHGLTHVNLMRCKISTKLSEIERLNS